MEKMNDLKDLLKHEIEDLYSVEEQIIGALPKMIEKANNKELKKALSEHLKVTEQHKKRLDKIQQLFDEEDGGGKKKGVLESLFGGKQTCKGMKGIIEEGNKIMSADISPEALDAAIIASAQKVEHYEICGYGTARTFARELGLEPIAKQLEQTLNEEYEADDLLTKLAVQRINLEAESLGNGSASSAGRSQVRERAGRAEMEMVSNSRNGSSRMQEDSSPKGRSNGNSGGQPKTSGSPRSEGSGRGASSSKKATVTAAASKSSGRSKTGSGRSSSGRR
jgi:ferritin-like metal-binding protein YciE